MFKRTTMTALLLAAALLAGCGGEPAPTPTPLPTFTPTTPPTATPAATNTPEPGPTAETPAAVATDAATGPITATETTTGTESITATETTTATVNLPQVSTGIGDGGPQPESPLAQPESPLPAPGEASAPADAAAPITATATITPPKPVSGYWELVTITAPTTLQAVTPPLGYRLELGATGVAKVSSDCKTGRGRYVQGPDSAFRLEVALSDQSCAPGSLAEGYARALGTVNGYRYEDNRLVLTYGDQGGAMSFAPVVLPAPFGAPIVSWAQLLNGTYLIAGTPVGDSQARLINGEARAALPDGSGDYVVALATAHAYGDLDADGVLDAAIVLVAGPEAAAGAATGAPAETPAATPETAAPAEPPAETDTATGTATGAPTATLTSTATITATTGITDTGASTNTTSAAPTTLAAGGTGQAFYLLPVLNGAGMAIPLQPQLLGENLAIRSLQFDGPNVVVTFDTPDPVTGECCTGPGRTQTYVLDNDRFKQVSDAEAPALQPRAVADLPTQDMTLPFDAATGSASTTLTGAIDANTIHTYRVNAGAGQQMTVTVQSPTEDVWLTVYGEQDRIVLRSIRSEASTWSGSVPNSGPLIVGAVATGDATPYTLTVTLTGPATQAPPTPTPIAPAPADAQGENKVVHLAIEGSPSSATQGLLDVLGRNQATADFFVTGAQTAAMPQMVAAIAQAGHGVGVQAQSGPFAPTGGQRDLLFGEVGATNRLLGPAVGRCLRPPFAANDAYTRANAAELGYRVVQWDIDAQDGAGADPAQAAQAMAGQVFPGAVVRLRGGEGSQAAVVLEQLLPALAQQGYTFRSFCTP